MPLRFDEFVALVKAGYTKEDIDKMEAAEDAFKAGQQKAEQPKPEKPAEQPKPEKPAEQPKPEEGKKPDQSAGNPADSAALAGLATEIEALRKAVQAMNVNNAYRTDDKNVTAESILASIIQPAKKD